MLVTILNIDVDFGFLVVWVESKTLLNALLKNVHGL